jgi:hypothetical protein
MAVQAPSHTNVSPPIVNFLAAEHAKFSDQKNIQGSSHRASSRPGSIAQWRPEPPYLTCFDSPAAVCVVSIIGLSLRPEDNKSPCAFIHKRSRRM